MWCSWWIIDYSSVITLKKKMGIGESKNVVYIRAVTRKRSGKQRKSGRVKIRTNQDNVTGKKRTGIKKGKD